MERIKNTGLYLYTSNNLGVLASMLISAVKDAKLLNPLKDRHSIIVQTEGMMKYLSMNIADNLGICSNFRFSRPREFMFGVLKECKLIAENDMRYFEKGNMTVEILKLLRNEPESIFSQDDRRNNYSEYIKTGVNLGQFAIHVADVFDQYMTYRPEFISENSEIKDEWQRKLFKSLLSRGGLNPVAPAEAISNFINSFKWENDGISIPNGQCDAVYLFAVSVLPPLYIEFFRKLSGYRRINIYNISPSKEFWLHDLSEKESLKILKKENMSNSPELMHISRGNPILMNNGQLLQDFYSLLYSSEPAPTETSEYKEFKCGTDNFAASSEIAENSQVTVLGLIKKAMLHNYPEMPGSEVILSDGNETTKEKSNNPETDYSFQVHSYHNRLRETEGLYNYICGIIDKDPLVKLEEILVMCPDIEKYAPYIDGVFSGKAFQYNISDNMLLEKDIGVRALMKILESLKYGGELTAEDLVGIFDLEPLRKKIEIDQVGFETILNWIKELNMRWGLTGDYLRSLYPQNGNVQTMEIFNTIEYAAKRLFIGYVGGSCGGSDFIADVPPYAGVSVSSGETAGKFLFVIDKLAELTEAVKKDLTMSEWDDFLGEAITVFMSEEYFDGQGFSDFTAKAKKLRNDDVVIDFETYLELLRNITLDARNTYSFMRGGITFCELLPLRSIPFKAVCLLGLNDSDFPRRPAMPIFNQMEKEYRKGDRSPRLNDRLLFLESIVSAEEYLYISYIGRNEKNNKIVNPSAPLAELMEFAGIKAIEHPLHSFSPKYFESASDDNSHTRLLNFNRDDYELASILSSANSAPILNAAISNNNAGNDSLGSAASNAPAYPAYSDESKGDKNNIFSNNSGVIQLSELNSFLKDPVKKYFNSNGIYLYEKEDEIKSVESIFMGRFDEYLLRKDLFFGEIKDIRKPQASGFLPHARVGVYHFYRIKEQVDRLRSGIAKLLESGNGDGIGNLGRCRLSLEDFKPLNVKKTTGAFSIEGKLDLVFQETESYIMLELNNSELPKGKGNAAVRFALNCLLGDIKIAYFASFKEHIKTEFNNLAMALPDTLQYQYGQYKNPLDIFVGFYEAASREPLILSQDIYKKILYKLNEGDESSLTEKDILDFIKKNKNNIDYEDPYIKTLEGNINDFFGEEYLQKITMYNVLLFGFAESCFGPIYS